MRENYILECCVDSVESALLAAEGGADRLELCGNLIIGGTTPDIFLFNEIKKHTDIKIYPLLRPRYGDFLYSDYEINIMKQNILKFKESGADGIVIGCLTEDGDLDQKIMQDFIDISGNMKITLHRAFDMCRAPLQTLQQAIDLGIHTILTSGQANTCEEGAELISELINCAGNKIKIMAGAGVNYKVINKFLHLMPIKHFHMSGKILRSSGMKYRKQAVSMGLPFMSEYDIIRTDLNAVKLANKVITQYGE